MDTATEDIYLQKMEEFVHDEDKIVTFKWLSLKLNINVQEAKHVLSKYVNDQRQTKDKDLSLTFLISGILMESDSLGILVVKEGELESKKCLFSNIISEEIYSVQKCNEVDVNILGLVDQIDVNNPRESPIVGSVIGKNCVIRKYKSRKPVPESQKSSKQQATKNNKNDVHTKSEILSSSSDSQNIHPTPENKKKQARGGIASFFNKTPDKKGSNIKPEFSEKEKKESVTNGEGKVSEVNKKSSVKNSEPTITDNIKSSLTKIVDTDSESEETIKTKHSEPKESMKKRKSNTKRPRKISNNEPTPKRRRRIVERNDSDSDDIFGNDENNEDVIDGSDEDCKPVKKPEPVLAPKNKRRKLIDQTYTDEEGYILTRKEWVYESASEDEKEVTEVKHEDKPPINEPKKSVFNGGNESVPSKPLNGKGKKGKKNSGSQPTLMNFFKKN